MLRESSVESEGALGGSSSPPPTAHVVDPRAVPQGAAVGDAVAVGYDAGAGSPRAAGGASQAAGAGAVFSGDSAKPWYAFGRGSVDQSGARGGPAWVPDAACNECMGCRAEFTLLRRRHHCRNCGRVFCASCSAQQRMLPASFGVREPQRVCAPCADVLEPLQDELVATISNATRSLSAPGVGAGEPSGLSLANPVSFSMTAEIVKATAAVYSFFGLDSAQGNQRLLRDEHIPAMLLAHAKGLAFLTVVKAGFFFSGRFGSGLVIGRDRLGGWTAPSAIGLAGVGWGAQIGGEVVTHLVLLQSEAAVDAFSGKGQVSLGTSLAVAAGPLGRAGEAGVNIGDGGGSPCLAYSQSRGLFVGLSLEGAAISARDDVNERFYGRHWDPKDLLAGGRVPLPNAAQPLYDALNLAVGKIPMQAAAAAAAALSAGAGASNAPPVSTGPIAL
jgi:lipid-binding SYLF domain-containing protein